MNHQISLCLSSQDQCNWRRAVQDEVNLSRKKDHCVKMEVIMKEIKGKEEKEKNRIWLESQILYLKIDFKVSP